MLVIACPCAKPMIASMRSSAGIGPHTGMTFPLCHFSLAQNLHVLGRATLADGAAEWVRVQTTCEEQITDERFSLVVGQIPAFGVEVMYETILQSCTLIGRKYGLLEYE